MTKTEQALVSQIYDLVTVIPGFASFDQTSQEPVVVQPLAPNKVSITMTITIKRNVAAPTVAKHIFESINLACQANHQILGQLHLEIKGVN